MNREKPYFLKRIIAYIIDLLIVTLLAGILSSIFIKNDNYQNETLKLTNLLKSYSEGEITKEEYTEEYESINYYLTRESVGISVINCSLAIVYYCVLAFYCGGITLGKYIMKLRIVSANDKKLHLGNYLIRSLLVNLILSNIISVMMVCLLKKETFMQIYPKISNILTIFMFVTLIVMMYREDGRGLHDLVSNTKIVSTKMLDKKDENQEVVEAKVLEEKKSKNKSKKKRDEIK